MKYGTWKMELENETITMKNRIWYMKHGKLNTEHQTWNMKHKSETIKI